MPALKRLGIDLAGLRMRKKHSERQDQTGDAFGFQWSKRVAYDSIAVKTDARKWLFERYCHNRASILHEWLKGGRKIILDAGCGAGLSALLFFGRHLKHHDYLGVDVSAEAIDVVRTRFREAGYPGEFLNMDLMDLPISNGSIDMIFSEGVLHHTDSVERSIKYLAKKLKPGGRFLFYVYLKKAAIREFTDDHIRRYLADMGNKEAWEALKPLTRLGMELGRQDFWISVPEDIPFLGIHKGKTSLQRFFYWNICKLFYKEQYSLDEMNHMNFDWFRLLNCHRHTAGEIKRWCFEAGLNIEHSNIQKSGITIVAVKNRSEKKRSGKK